ncbi:hypothetical protein G647_09383 [Cladophialophora carrionii CBS 160.54]|uniref:U6 small nuclear RNA (adenine-(43)-N(6))-methyltransferase n=1 Tax=Cladophialophora carrionii CBS 160.54 TaxID=1279043 RepID=V9CY44_9EURO|nr:uncharacterized protein G647_09383 [Cladophialophora carrionii CBS 160.54]ETI19549.1 hypothetical protein G647_09383 [Cladophialophora carrionii CBS 160.54]
MPAPDNIYEDDVDFTTLALQYPDFAKRGHEGKTMEAKGSMFSQPHPSTRGIIDHDKHKLTASRVRTDDRLKPNRQLDFSDPESVRQLTKCLLHRDFNLTIDVPDDRLCPPVPNRFNYILFIQRLLDDTSPDFHQGYDRERQVLGLDIGTGSSAIYPLLACAQRPRWRFLCTEIDDKNRQYAQRNISANNLGSRIRMIDTDRTGGKLIPAAQLEHFDRVDVLVTNPPFYSSEAELLGSAGQKSRPPNSSCTGAAVEMITPGGEVSFVGKLIRESAHAEMRRKVQWFSAMLGKLSSVGTIVTQLRNQGCTNFAVTEFVQGQKTRRWCVAWSWMGFRPGGHVARGVRGGSGVEKKWLPPLTEMEFDCEVEDEAEDRDENGDENGDGNGDRLGTARAVAEKVTREIRKLDGVAWKFDAATGVGMFMAREGDVWSRKARRKAIQVQDADASGRRRGCEVDKNRDAQRNRGRAPDGLEDTVMEDREESEDDDDESEQETEPEPEPALVARISIRTSPLPLPPADTRTRSKRTIHIRHLQGHDAVLFESFCGWLKRKVVPPSR